MFTLILSCICNTGHSQQLKTSARAQANSWTTINFDNPLRYQLGARFIPEIRFEQAANKISFDAQLSFNTTGSMDFQKGENTGYFEKFKPYRIWGRVSGSRYEIRFGLQKINFGSAMILRPLMWFDRIDPRDPLQLTDGVYALLGRYYFKNNANIWLWGLMWNDETKGWETIPSMKKNPEVGGRFQFPISTGEVAVSFHHRKANLAEFYEDTVSLEKISFNQNRYALDGKWDIGIGVWFEYVLEENNIPSESYPLNFQHAINIGMDYTFSLGNGLNASTEFFFISQSDNFFESEINTEVSALSVNYPLSLINQVSAIIYYNWEDESLYRFISLQKTYDFWSFYLMGYWNPDQFGLYNLNETQNLFTGKGIQVMAVYNF